MKRWVGEAQLNVGGREECPSTRQPSCRSGADTFPAGETRQALTLQRGANPGRSQGGEARQAKRSTLPLELRAAEPFCR